MRRVLIYIMAIFFVSSCSKEEYEVIKYVSPTVTKSDGGESIDSISTDKPAPVVDTLKLVSTEYKLANLMVEDKSSITLRFNKPVTASEVVVNPKSHITNVILNPDLSLVTANGDSTLIVYLDMYYGEIYNCCAKVIDKETRKTLPFSFTLNTYADIYEYDGIMWNVISDDERETMWLATEDRSLLNVEDAKPFRISRISIDNPSKPTAYIDLRQEPNVMALNPYNNKLYVGTLIKNDYDRYEKYYDYKIHILNSETLVEEGAFVISQKVTKVWSDGHETYYPDVSPRAMAFTDDGFGVIVLKEYTSQGVQLCYVDCRDGHSLKYDRDCWDFFYRDVKTNYDKKSLIIYCMDTFGPEFYTVSRNNPNPKLYAIDHKYHSTHPYAGGGISCRLLHKSKPLYYAQSLYSLCRIDYSTDTYSPVLIDDARSCKMEIDYLDDNFVVSVDPLLHVMKYKDTSADDIAYVSYWDRGVVLDSYYPMFHNTSRDMLITFLGPNGKTYLTMYDMKPIRQSKADKNSPY